MATTTNYSWTTPDDTDLVKDGAAAIRTLGSSADTTVKALNPGTTAGDIDYYTAATTKARIAIGTAGQVLQVNSGATAPEWTTLPAAGGMTLISTTTLSGASVTLGSIVGTYKHLLLLVTSATNATSNGYFTIDPNAAGNLADTGQVEAGASDTVGGDTTALDKIRTNYNTAIKSTGGRNYVALWIYDYASTTLTKPFSGSYSYEAGGDSTMRGGLIGGGISTTSAITSLVLANSGGNFNGGTALLYGVA